MKTWSFGMIVRHLLVVTLLLFVLYALVDLLYFSLHKFPGYLDDPIGLLWDQIVSRGADSWQDRWQADLEESPPLSRTVTISATMTSISFDFDLWIPKTHTLARYGTGGYITSQFVQAATSQFVQAAFGEVWISGSKLREGEYSPLTWTVDPTTQLVGIHVQASRATEGPIWAWISRRTVSSITLERSLTTA